MATTLITTELNENITYKADDVEIGFVARSYVVSALGESVEIWLNRQAEDRLLSSLLARKAARDAEEV